jgi:hypothetical protein
MRALVVTHAFADFKVGDQITDPTQIDELKESHSASNFVQVDLPEFAPVANATPA